MIFFCPDFRKTFAIDLRSLAKEWNIAEKQLLYFLDLQTQISFVKFLNGRF